MCSIKANCHQAGDGKAVYEDKTERNYIMNRKSKRLLILLLSLVLMLAVVVPSVSVIKSRAAAWLGPVNSCYTVTASGGLPIKASQSASAATYVTVPKGTEIYVVSITTNGAWGYTGYNGKYGWVQLSGALRNDDDPETTAELQARFEAIIQFMPNGSTWKGSKNNDAVQGTFTAKDGTIGPWECFGYASEVWRALFGTEMARSYYSNKYIFYNDPDMSLKGTLSVCTEASVKSLLLRAQPGDIIQAVSKSGGQHTMVVYDVASDGIYICDANWSSGTYGKNKVRVKRFYTWAQIYAERGGKMSLYTSSDYPPEKAVSIVAGDITVKNSSGAAATEFTVRDTIKFSASIKNARSVTYYIVNANTDKVVHTYTSSFSDCSYTFTALDGGSTSYYVYYVATNAAGSKTSGRKQFTVKMPTVAISGGNVTLELGKTHAFSGKVSYSPTSRAKLTWVTGDASIATVNSSGVVTAKKAGTTTVTVTMAYTGTSGGVVRVTATVKVTVFNPKYTVSFDSNGGSGSFASITVEKTKQYGTLPTPTRKGYTFAGWYTAKSGGTLITATSTVSISQNTTLYARWTANKYTITLDGNGGTPAKPTVTGVYESPLGTLPVATRPGYNFDGWYTAAEGGTKITSATVYTLTNGTTYYAHWSLASFTVTFDAVGGTASKPNITVTFTGKYGELPMATRPGFEFDGWYMGKNGEGEMITADSVVNIVKDTILYAKWNANTYTISFDVNGGIGGYEDRDILFDSPYGSLPIPGKPGYAFVGWYTELEGGTRVTDITKVFVPSNHTLYAHWEPGKFAVTLDANGGITPQEVLTVTYLELYGELPVPTRVGYTFIGWWTEAEGGQQIVSSTVVEIIQNQTLYAHWSVNTYTVSFETFCNESFAPVRIVFDTPYGSLPRPDKRGYTFVGWYTESEGGQHITETSTLKIGEDSTLYAHWKANSYVVSFDANSGVVNSESITVVFDSGYPQLPVAERYGYEFMGWYTALENGEPVEMDTTVSIDRDHVLYARWSARLITVEFDTDGGDAQYTNMAYKYDSPYGKLPWCVRVGYTFMGWQTADGDFIKIDTVIDSVENIKVTAIWEAISYNVVLDANGGSMSETEETAFVVTYDEVYPYMGTPARFGYRFVGWKTNRGNYAYSGEVVKIISSQTLYAEWAPLLHVVTLDANGGKLDVAQLKIGYQQKYGDLPTPVMTGYSFAGWVDKDGNKITADSVSSTTEAETLTATWTERVYVLSFDANGGEMEPTQIKIKYGEIYAGLPVPERTGYKFTRWLDGDGNAIYEQEAAELTDDTLFYAEWIPYVLDIQFESGCETVIPPMTVTYDSNYTGLPTASRNGYVFLGWYDIKGNLVKEQTKVTITEGITLYARWEAIEYDLTFDAMGGQCDTSEMVFSFDDLDGALPIPQKIGCVFIGWYDEFSVELTEDAILDPDSTNEFYARWANSEYNLYFSVNGSINRSLTQKVGFKRAIGVLPTLTIPGYQFVCWTDSTGTQVRAEDVYTDVADKVLYAVITPRTYVVTFDANGGQASFDEMNITNDETYGELPTAFRHGYVLVGWFDESGMRITAETVVSVTNNTRLCAQWAEVESNTSLLFRNNSTLATSCEVIALVEIVLLLLTFLRKKFGRKKIRT